MKFRYATIKILLKCPDLKIILDDEMPLPRETNGETSRNRKDKINSRTPALNIHCVPSIVCIQLFRERLSNKTVRDNAEKCYG